MIKLEFATDIRKSCKTCIRFHKEGQFCMIQESNTGGNPHPPIPNPDAWTCNMQKTVAELFQNPDTPCAGCDAANDIGLCLIDHKLFHESCPYQDGAQVVSLGWAIKNATDVLDLITKDHHTPTDNEIIDAMRRGSFTFKPKTSEERKAVR